MKWYNWTMLTERDEDLQIVGWEFNLEKIPDIKLSTIEYNQNEFAKDYGYCLCSLYAPIWWAENIKEINEKDRKDLSFARIRKTDFDINSGWYWHIWVDLIRNYLKLYDKEIIQYTFKKTDSLFYWFLDKWYRIIIWLSIKDEFFNDSQSDWILDSDWAWSTKYGHFATIKKVGENYCIVDNYKWVLKYNIYTIKQLDKLISNWVIFNSCYVFLNWNTKKLTIWNWTRADDNITRNELNIILKRLFGTWANFFNWLEPDRTPSLKEAEIMVKRAFLQEIPVESIKRWNIINKLIDLKYKTVK